MSRCADPCLPGQADARRKGFPGFAAGTPEQFGKFTRAEYEKWKAIVRDSGAAAA